jgi:hypothetical protein
MELRVLLTQCIRDFLAPRYRPELHYMRGPGPAYERRAVLVESRRMLPILRKSAPFSPSRRHQSECG